MSFFVVLHRYAYQEQVSTFCTDKHEHVLTSFAFTFPRLQRKFSKNFKSHYYYFQIHTVYTYINNANVCFLFFLKRKFADCAMLTSCAKESVIT